MGEKELNSDNGKRQNKKATQDNINYQQIQQQIINEMNKQAGNFNSGDSTNQSVSDPSNISNNPCIKELADKAVNINVLRFELDRLQLDFKARAYFENDVRPLIDTLYTLSLASSNYSITASNFANTNFGHSKKIKEALDLSEEVNDIAEDLIEVLRCKVDNMLKLSKCDCK